MDSFIIKTSMREVDCTEFEPIIRHPIFTRLNQINQLSFVDKVYRGAKHSRYDHSIFVYHFTNEITNHLLKKGCISLEDKRNLEIASIIHDIGHGPESHAFEFVAEGFEKINGKRFNHEMRSAELIESDKRDRNGRTLKNCIEKCRGNPDIIKEIILRKSQLSHIIYHNTIGSNVTSYVLMDSNRTNYFWSMPFFLDIFPHYFFDGKTLGLQNEVKEPQIEDLQFAYQRMYINVYFHPTVRYFERLYEKIVQLLIENDMISAEEMWGLEDFKMYQILKDNKQANDLFVRIQNEEIDKKFLSMNYKFFGVLSEKFAEFCSNPLNLSKLERKISAEFDCGSEQITCVLTAVPSMIIPEDVFIFKWGESVFQKFPSHYQNLIERAERNVCLNVYSGSGIDLDADVCKKMILDEIKS